MPARRPVALVVTCEHGGFAVPRRFGALFRGRRALLASHRGHDRGALSLARRLAAAMRAPLFAATASRLVVDLNRSEGSRALFSRPMRDAPAALREHALRTCYRPYRADVARAIRRAIARGHRVLHVSVHSFTPVLRGAARRTDVGLLYDPSRAFERALCAAWRRALLARAPRWLVRRNRPYRGVSDGHATALRRAFPASRYAGVELEVSQARVRAASWPRAQAWIVGSLADALRAMRVRGRR